MINPNPSVLCEWHVDGELCGAEWRRSLSTHPNALPSALHYSCPWCGVEWASSSPIAWPQEYPPLRHTFLTTPCSSCGTGSLANVMENLYHLPHSLLQRELSIACNAPQEYGTLLFFERPRRQTK